MLEFFQGEEIVCVAVDTDGQDYIAGVAGAICDGNTNHRAVNLGIEVGNYLRQFNTNELHQQPGTLVKMRPTGTNIGDVHILLRNKYIK